jgi:anti-sigma factor RsiW
LTHLGQRLSALIDGELDGSERERVLLHMAKCGSCREEVASLRMLKRRMNELGEAAAGAALTGRLMRLRESGLADGMPVAEAAWPPPPPPGDWEFRGDAARPEQRAGRYFLAGSLVVFLAGLGTAAFIAGGEPQPQAPSPPVAPSVDVLVVPHGSVHAQGSRLRDRDWANTAPYAVSARHLR